MLLTKRAAKNGRPTFGHSVRLSILRNNSDAGMICLRSLPAIRKNAAAFIWLRSALLIRAPKPACRNCQKCCWLRSSQHDRCRPEVVTKLASLHSASTWPAFRLCARPSRQNPPATKPDFRLAKFSIQSTGKLVCPKTPTRPDCAHRYARPCHHSISSAKFSHSGELL